MRKPPAPRKKYPPTASRMNQITIALSDPMRECLEHWSKTSLIPKRRLVIKALMEAALRQGYTFPTDDDPTD